MKLGQLGIHYSLYSDYSGYSSCLLEINTQ